MIDEEICKLCAEGMKVCGDTEDCPFIDLSQKVAKAQEAATLKEVGEWLDGPCEHAINRQRFQCIRCLLTIKSALQRGEIPGVGG